MVQAWRHIDSPPAWGRRRRPEQQGLVSIAARLGCSAAVLHSVRIGPSLPAQARLVPALPPNGMGWAAQQWARARRCPNSVGVSRPFCMRRAWARPGAPKPGWCRHRRPIGMGWAARQWARRRWLAWHWRPTTRDCGRSPVSNPPGCLYGSELPCIQTSLAIAIPAIRLFCRVLALAVDQVGVCGVVPCP